MARKAYGKHATQVDTSSYPDDGTSPVGSNEWNAELDKEGMLGFSPQSASTPLTIASGVATVTDTVTVVTSESGTSDTLDKLATTNTSEYDLIYLFANTGHTITLTHTSSPSAAGHVFTVGQANETLSSTKPTILIRKGNYWYGYGGGTVSDGSITTVKLADNAVTGAKIAMTSDAAGDVIYYNGTDYTRLAIGSANQVLQVNSGASAPEWAGVTATEIADNAVSGAKIALGSDAQGDIMYYNGTDYVRLAKGTAGQSLQMNSGATAPEWAAGGGGATATHAYTNQSSTSYAGTGTSGTGIDVNTTVSTEASGAGEREIFIKKIDTNNEGVFAIIHKNGKAVEVQIA